MNNPFDIYRNQNTRTEEESRRLQIRTASLIALFGAVLLAFLFTLYQLQIINGDYYLANANSTVVQTESVDSVRGEILDCYGRPLVTNQLSYNVELDVTLMGSARAEILSRLLALCEVHGVTWTDTLPISAQAPWEYTKEQDLFCYQYEDDQGNLQTLNTRLGSLAKKCRWISDPTTADLSAEELLQAMCRTFGLPEQLTPQVRQLAGVLYEVWLRTYEVVYTQYTFAQNVDITFISAVKENSLTGVNIVTATSRSYTTSYASHVLGRVAAIDAEEWPSYREQGYPMDAYVGKAGIELAFEAYLRGTAGLRQVERDENGKLITQEWITEPEPGSNVVLTIDSALQAVTEAQLEQFVTQLENPRGAAAAVLDMTGGVLALASYPTYDLSTFSADYNELLADPHKPLFNRATMGLYAPGSTFKPLVAIAALSSGTISTRETVYCGGVYEHYPDYQPVCWIYTNTGGHHGTETVSKAITDSCNIFFYDVGRRTGIATIVEYAHAFGLGRYTGIEIGEYQGRVAGPETSAALGTQWYGGLTLSASIGQGDNQFTPLQLANYIATLVNGGNHYEVHLLKQVKSGDYGQTLLEYEPVLKDTIQINAAALSVVKKGMYDLSKTYTMSQYFSALPVEVGCKTGTAEVSGSEANSVFVCFAPYDDPQVALCLVAEGGSAGGSLAEAAAAILSQYFAMDGSLSLTPGEGELIH